MGEKKGDKKEDVKRAGGRKEENRIFFCGASGAERDRYSRDVARTLYSQRIIAQYCL